MLHSAIPRTFLPPPGLCYLGGYYGETVNPYSSITRFVPLENAYASISSHHNEISSELSRSVSPIPLDLSVKSLPAPEIQANEDCETIEVDDVEDNRDDDGFASDKAYPEVWANGLVPEEHPSSPVPRSYSNYDDRYHQEAEKIRESSYHFTSPKTLRSIQNYPQQLLLTPQQHSLQGISAPMTPPSTPSPPQCPRRRPRDDEETCSNLIATPKSSTIEKTSQRPKKKHARRLKFDEDTSSPVSGTVILGPDEAVVTGDIDPAFNIVEVTEEARAELAKIENRLGPYQCKLCRQLHEDAFQLAQHRCSRIAHVEYRCPECDKRFSCPANLASHRRWHKPRIPASDSAILSGVPNSKDERDNSCGKCDAKFSRPAALRKHLLTQHPEMANISLNNDNDRNNNDDSNNNANNVSMEIMRGTLSSPKAIISSLPLGGDLQSTEMA